ncbi:hypothetical protein [Azospirillum soli]|uniref:hypothetical protein n=1 Tax=Azospirillum soli TaxID=1304799 RepID=UPI001AE59211|nr:hypothetical protein [Azospirillum soli]MBP2314703.1 hypothetical protein [Azospirillum soli]
MTGPVNDLQYTAQLVRELCGDRFLALAPEHQGAICAMFDDIMNEEGIEALTPARVDTIIAYTATHLLDAA